MSPQLSSTETADLIATAEALADAGVAEIEAGTPAMGDDEIAGIAAVVALALPPREHSLLEALLMNQGKTMSKASLMQSVFGLEGEASEDALEIYVHRLRRKLETSQAAIVTLRGLGYLLTPRQAA